jgi:methylglyoxal/glyoxal reductase
MATEKLTLTSTVTLSNGVKMPRFGLGVYKSEPGAETENAVRIALEQGYPAVDTATFYQNEADVGRAVREFRASRGSVDGSAAASGETAQGVFVTTKLWNSDQGYDNALRAFDRSLDELGMEQIDLYLVHWPKPELMADTWRALERIYEEKRCRAIGVSNFEPHHLEELAAHANVAPVVNQVELHPYLQQRSVCEYCADHDIVVTAWSPIARGRVVDDPVLREIGAAHGKSAVHVALRWELQRGIVTIPKSVHEDRIVLNMQLYDFSLSDEEMKQIDGLDRGEELRLGPHPDHIDF